MPTIYSNELSIADAIVYYILKRNRETSIFVSVTDSHGQTVMKGVGSADRAHSDQDKASFLAACSVYRDCDTIEISGVPVADHDIHRYFLPLLPAEIRTSHIPLSYFRGGAVILKNVAAETIGAIGVYSPGANEHVSHYLAELGRAWYVLTQTSR